MLDFDIWTIVFSIINILVLFLFLKKFLFGRIQNIMDQRAAAVQADLDQAKASAAEAQQLRQQYEDTLSGAKQEANGIIANARAAAKEQGNQITLQAQKEADQLLKAAQKEIALERQNTLAGAQKEIADLALAAAAKLVEAKMDDAENRSIVDAFLTEEGVKS
ncbi:MAG: F0F1 ATP synthase subunit B [Oscillospiraceae bacterium]|nr:F0F1 ATP synthase subunit B [Ruminococcus sp.]MDD7294829.1 F0F1 ATP synthase subunit B [Oscillospiraceae bacterium]MDY2510435.1 F0F1 ATP synthase subunit B [Ruminococcus callidus]